MPCFYKTKESNLKKKGRRAPGYCLFLVTGCIGLIFILRSHKACAESVRLKSGKVINGEVLEKTDEYIEMDTGETVFRIRFSSLDAETRQRFDSQDTPQTISETHPVEGQDVSQEDSVADWTGWYMTSAYYMNQVQRNLYEMEQIAQKMALTSRQAIKMNDQKMLVQIMQEARREIKDLLETFKAVSPPQEFQFYHDKILEYQEFTQKLPETYLLLDRQGFLINRKRALRSLIHSFEELNRLCRKHGAPGDFLRGINDSIKLYRQYLNTY